MNELKPEDVMGALEEFASLTNCNNMRYLEGCGHFCKVLREPIDDMAGGRSPKCNEHCEHYSPPRDEELFRATLALLREKDARIKELEEAQGAEFTCFVGEPHKVDHCPYGDEIVKKDAEIERLKKSHDLAVKERETNVKGFTEELQNTIARYKGVIRILEQDIAARDKIIEGKIEEAFPEFMRDYKQLQKEYSELRDEIVDRYVEMCKRAFNFGETIMEKSICDILCKVAKDLKEVSQ